MTLTEPARTGGSSRPAAKTTKAEITDKRGDKPAPAKTTEKKNNGHPIVKAVAKTVAKTVIQEAAKAMKENAAQNRAEAQQPGAGTPPGAPVAPKPKRAL